MNIVKIISTVVKSSPATNKPVTDKEPHFDSTYGVELKLRIAQLYRNDRDHIYYKIVTNTHLYCH
jgi:hypothetical protein